MFHTTVRIAVAVMVAVALSSCQKGNPNLPLSRNETPLQHTNRIVVLDRDVRNTLLFVNSIQKRLSGGHLLIQANFENRMMTQDVWADIGFEFMDGNNMVVDKTEWMTTLFPAGQVTMIQGSSIGPGAVKHVLLLKNLKTATGRMIGPASKIMVFP